MCITICEIDCQSKFDAWNRALKASVLEQPRGMGWEGRWEGRGSGWGTHVHPWLIHVNVWQNPPQYCKVISLQLKLINFKKAKTLTQFKTSPHLQLRPSLVFPFGGRGTYNWFHVYFLVPLILPLAAVVRGLVEGRERVKDQEWGTVLPGAVAWYRPSEFSEVQLLAHCEVLLRILWAPPLLNFLIFPNENRTSVPSPGEGVGCVEIRSTLITLGTENIFAPPDEFFLLP